MMVVVVMMTMLEKNLEDGIQVINILETFSATHRETTSISNVRRPQGKGARTGPSPQD